MTGECQFHLSLSITVHEIHTTAFFDVIIKLDGKKKYECRNIMYIVPFEPSLDILSYKVNITPPVSPFTNMD